MQVVTQFHGGLYRDDVLQAVNNSNGPWMDKSRKKILSLFKEEYPSITIDTNYYHVLVLFDLHAYSDYKYEYINI